MHSSLYFVIQGILILSCLCPMYNIKSSMTFKNSRCFSPTITKSFWVHEIHKYPSSHMFKAESYLLKFTTSTSFFHKHPSIHPSKHSPIHYTHFMWQNVEGSLGKLAILNFQQKSVSLLSIPFT